MCIFVITHNPTQNRCIAWQRRWLVSADMQYITALKQILLCNLICQTLHMIVIQSKLPADSTHVYHSKMQIIMMHAADHA